MGKLERRTRDIEKALGALKAISCEPYSVVVRDAAIQRFEYTFEAFWKFVRDYLREVDGITCNSPRSCFREALGSGLIGGEQTVACMEMTDDRNLTSHTYVEELAEQIYKKVENYRKLMESILVAGKKNFDGKK